jgi:hypothetical protein
MRLVDFRIKSAVNQVVSTWRTFFVFNSEKTTTTKTYAPRAAREIEFQLWQ